MIEESGKVCDLVMLTVSRQGSSGKGSSLSKMRFMVASSTPTTGK